MEASLFLNRLRNRSIPNRFELPIDEDLCKKGLLCTFATEVESGLHKYRMDEQQVRQIGLVARWLVSHYQKWGLLLNGIPGNGKTTTLHAIRSVINALDIIDTETNEIKTVGLWVKTASELCEMFLRDKKQFDRYKTTPLLGIDEFGLEPENIVSYGNVFTPLTDILAYRYQNRLFTILTTNVANSDIRPKYGDRIAARMNEMFEIVLMPDIDFRKNITPN